jgi:hypothetical protein
LELEVQGLQALPKQVSLSRRQVAELEAKAMQKDDQLTELRQQLDQMGDIPKLLSVKRREVGQLQSIAEEKEQTIAQLQGQLDGFQAAAKMTELTEQQIKDLEEATRQKEAQLQALKQQFMQELSKRPVRYVGIPVSTMVTPRSPVRRFVSGQASGAARLQPAVVRGHSFQPATRRPSAVKVVVSPTHAVHPAGIGA